MASQDSFGAKGTLDVDGKSYEIFRLDAVDRRRARRRRRCRSASRCCWRTCCAPRTAPNITADDIKALAGWDADADPSKEIQFTPARVIMQDFTGVPVRRRPRHHARGDGRARRRRHQDQPARAGRDGHRPLRDRRRLRHAGGVRAQRRDRVRAQPRALPVPALGPGRLRRLQGRPARHRHRAPGQHRAPRAHRLHPRESTASRRSPTPTPASAPTRTPRWSTASASSAGASAASRPRPRCSASRSRC